jgi:hypothetical protein
MTMTVRCTFVIALKHDKKNGYFTSKHMYIFHGVSLSSVYNETYTVCLKGKCTDFPMDELEM